jgi:hypothetical protein
MPAKSSTPSKSSAASIRACAAIMPKGPAPDDQILQYRSSAYAESYTRREARSNKNIIRHKDHEGHEGKHKEDLFMPFFVLLVPFVVICLSAAPFRF